jgi:hypothetical protein
MTMNSLATEERKAQPWLNLVASQGESLRLGSVQIVVHDSQGVQIDRTEKRGSNSADAPLVVAIIAEGRSRPRTGL